ncbi:MAG: hypothetical protein LUD19_01945, partial [Clostridia bacterium]|nr:hypothetical protein [Clostridia bacterium]
EYRYEDDCTTCIFTLDGWSRGSKIALTQAADKIRDAFADLQEVRDDVCYFVRYSGAQGIPSGEADLYRISITLYTYEWKGD